MSVETLQWLRWITPGVIIVFFTGVLGQLTGMWSTLDIHSPIDIEKPTLSVIIPAAIYYLTPLRTWSNQHYFNKISEHLRMRLLQIANIPDDPKKYTWKTMRGIFFSLIDNDNSLTVKSKIIYFNGYLWTTAADIRILSLSYILPSGALYFLGIGGSIPALMFFVVVATITVPISSRLTRRHRSLGEEQLEIIQQKYAASLRQSLDRIAN